MRHNLHSKERQAQIYEVIKEFLTDKGYPPSVREIGSAVGLKSSSTVHGYLDKLEENGFIRRDPAKPRAIDLLDAKPWEGSVSLPLVGTVAAGVPILAEENIEDIMPFPRSLVGDNPSFVLRVNGESMINAGINDGDFVIVNRQNTAENGEIVVALVGNEAATVKRIYMETDCIRLQPENDTMKPFYEKEVTILGKVVGVYHQM